MANYRDENGNLVASTTFMDARGNYYVDGLEVSQAEYEKERARLQGEHLLSRDCWCEPVVKKVESTK